MKLMWHQRGNLRVSNEILYNTGVQVGEKLYLIGFKGPVPQEGSNPNGIMVSELDLDTMKIDELILIEEIRLFEERVLVYDNHIIITDPIYGSQQVKFAKINPRTGHVEKMTIDLDICDRDVVSVCIIEDHIYMSLVSYPPESTVSVLTVDLKSWKQELIEGPNAPSVVCNGNIRAFAHGKNICFISFDDLTVSIFDTEAKVWTIFETHLGHFNPDYNLKMIYDTKFYINDEIFNFKYSSDSCLGKWINIFNCNSLSWRREKFSLPEVFNSDNCSHCFAYKNKPFSAFKGKIFIIQNSNNTINNAFAFHIQQGHIESIPNSDVMEICELDLNPLLG